MKTIHAVFEDGVFKPADAVDIPEHSEVEFEPRLAAIQHVGRPEDAGPESEAGLDAIYEILSARYSSGDPFASERHNEHQP